MKKLKGFTLMELLVAMVIGSMLLGLGYGTMIMLRRQLNDYHLTTDKITDEIKFMTLLSKEVFTSDKLRKLSDNSIGITGKEEIVYAWNDRHIVRITSLSSDTFFVGVHSSKFIFENTEIMEDGFLIDELNILCGVNGAKNEFTFTKQYSAEEFVRKEQDKETMLWQ